MKKILIKLFAVSVSSVLIPFFLIGLISGLVFDITKWNELQVSTQFMMTIGFILYSLNPEHDKN